MARRTDTGCSESLREHTLQLAPPVSAPEFLQPSSTKGERSVEAAQQPNIFQELPSALRVEERISFDPVLYNLRAETTKLLEYAGPQVGFGRFERDAKEIEEFTANEAVFNSFKYEKQWRRCVREAEGFLHAYERLVEEIICPRLKSKLGADTTPTTFFYQHPPTLRLQPGPSGQFRRVHRDAEYGHQVGEVNFWMPLTDPTKTRVTLWIESAPNVGDFHPIELAYGDVGMFHGTLCRHMVPANESSFTRVSMDFRIGVGPCFDPTWSLRGISHLHTRKQFVL